MTSQIHSRPWRLAAPDDDGSLHALGNGRLLVYGQGPDLPYVWGPPYTSTNLLTLHLVGPPNLTSVSSRESAALVWQHQLKSADADAGLISDFVDAELPCLLRRINARVPLRFALSLPDVLPPQEVPPAARYPGRLSLVAIHPAGTYEYFTRFRSVAPQAVHVVLSGAARIESGPDPAGLFTIVCDPGQSEILIAGGPEYHESLLHAEAALDLGHDALLARTRRHWAAFLAEIKLPDLAGPLAPAITQAAQDTALIIAAQQSAEGGVVAGHNFCLAYVRDQYGVSRALLALGLHRRARAILNFYWRIFQREGVIHNAQSIGPHTRFHVHENDDVEMTGWLIIQAFDYLAAAGDEEFLREIAPMLAWCADAPERHFVAGMLPFNGDETYVAGEFLPRTTLDDGSAEATLLYLAAVDRFNDWAARHNFGDSAALARRRMLLEEARRTYRENFFDGPRLLLNNPRRTDLAQRPRFRHGVCLGRLPGCRFFDWTELTPDGRYGCPVCFPRMKPVPRDRIRYFLPSVAATPALVGFPVTDAGEQLAMLEAALAVFTAPDGSLRWPETSMPGYELGLLLYALAERRDPRCPDLAKLLLDLRDPTGVWVEFYRGACPSSTRCRPWESALNLLGLLRAAEKNVV